MRIPSQVLQTTRRVTTTSPVVPGNQYDAIVIGGGHNGLVSAAYLARGGRRVCVLERRHIMGGAAVTEEIVPGYKFSRASYVLGLLRPIILQELQLQRHGLKVYSRDPSSYTPLREEYWATSKAKSLTLGPNEASNYQQVARFSEKDAKALPLYESLLDKFAKALSPLVDCSPPDIKHFSDSGTLGRLRQLTQLSPLLKTARILGRDFPRFYEIMTAPTTKILDRWFESEPLKATLATDSIIGAMMSPNTPGSGYVLLHHVMAQLAGVNNAWGYPEGGMSGVSDAIARAALEAGAELYNNQVVRTILMGSSNEAIGVETTDGIKIYAKHILSNATPEITLLKLLPKGCLPIEYEAAISKLDYTSPVCKINVALRSLPNFKADPNPADNSIQPHHRCTIHMNSENIQCLETAYQQCRAGLIPDKPMIEMVIPSSCDPTLAPPGHHVALLFTQYVPYTRGDGRPWDDDTREEYATKVFNNIEEYAPDFKKAIVGYEVLTPPDLEKIFGLTGGNIFHGAMSLDQLYIARPSTHQAGPQTPIPGLLLCGSGAHPGGGVMGAPGRLAALAVLGK